MGQPNKSEQTLAEAAEKGNADTRNEATLGLKSLQKNQASFSLLHPSLLPLHQAMTDAQTQETTALGEIATRRDEAKDQLKAISTRLQNVAYGIPDFSRIQVRHREPPRGGHEEPLQASATRSTSRSASRRKRSAASVRWEPR